MASKSWRLAVLVALALGCSEPEHPEQCRAYAAETAHLTDELTGLTETHDRWLDRWLSNEPGPPDAEQVFRQRCSGVGSRFQRLARDLAGAGADSPVGAAADRAERAASDLSATCMDLSHDSELGQDRHAREARLQSAADELRAATNAARRACGAPAVE